MSRRGHIPERRCLGCGARRPKPELARFVARREPAGRRLVPDGAGREAGRGLYVCRDAACFERARRRRGFERGARLRGEALIADDCAALAVLNEARC